MASSERGALSNAAIGIYALPGAGVKFLYTLIRVMYMSFATEVLGWRPMVGAALCVQHPTVGFFSQGLTRPGQGDARR